MQIEDLEHKASEAARLLGAMSNPRRLMVLCQLVEGEMNVTALAEAVGLSQSALSQHLAKLREAGLVGTRREAQTIYYRLVGEEATEVLRTLHRIYCQPQIQP
ncbi:MAG TPA: metalloregulator ArsR/SmtB family transcription factor [Alphaproteobacteria bacterium]|nr:metalloregulator ArsR/SmtB family transcription factor [Alphaproteobacteria bacterium]